MKLRFWAVIAQQLTDIQRGAICNRTEEPYGEKDWNVPVQNSEQLYQALRRLGVPTQLVVYPGEHHGGWSYAHEKDFQERMLAWFNKYLK